LIRMKFNYAHPAVQICADVHFFVLIRTGVRQKVSHKTMVKAMSTNDGNSKSE
jgi:hypothetical protein